MKGTLLLSLALISQAANCLTLHRRDQPATVGFSLQRNKIANSVRREYLKNKRDSAVGANIVSQEDNNLYFFNLTVGTPAQNISVGLDTGSSDLWFISNNATGCFGSADSCMPHGTYDETASSTSHLVNHDFEINYLDGSGASGDYVTDTVKFGEVTLEDFQFGVGFGNKTQQGTLGIGYTANEATANEYSNFPKALVNAGYIKSAAYSLWLDDIDAHKGTILFGGVNTAKYIGELQTLPVVPVYGQYSQLAVTLTGLSLQKGNSQSHYNSSDLPVYVVLDSGSTASQLPDSIARDIFKDVGATYLPELGYATVPCSLKDKGYNITYTFSGVTITSNVSELVLSIKQDDSQCMFGITASGSDMSILGDPFLRGAYVVYDLANNEISMANANFNPGKDNILEIGTGSDAVPSATKVASPVMTAASSVDGFGITPGATSTSQAALTSRAPSALFAMLAGASLLLIL